MRAARRALLVALAGCACNGQGSALAEGFGEAMAAAAVILLVLVVLAGVAYALAWARIAAALRGALADGADAWSAVRAWGWALLATIVHAGAVLLTSQWGFGDGPVASKLLLAAVVPLAALAGAAALAARRRTWWPTLPTAALVAATAVLALANWRMRPLAELPGRVVAIVAASSHHCALLSTGQITCDGPNWWGERGDGSEHRVEGPTLVRGIADATGVAVAHGLTCALRSEHPPACWGGVDELPVPAPRRLPWALPGAAAAVALAPAELQVTWLTDAGALGGWPNPPPADVARARLLVGDDDFDGAWLCVLDAAGALACWPEDDDEPRTVRRYDAPPAAHLAVDADVEVACVADAAAVRCFALADTRPPRTLELSGVEQLLAVDDDGTFCARGGRRVTCWRGDGAPQVPEGFADVDAVHAGGGLLCATTGERRRCIAPSGEVPHSTVFGERDHAP